MSHSVGPFRYAGFLKTIQLDVLPRGNASPSCRNQLSGLEIRRHNLHFEQGELPGEVAGFQVGLPVHLLA